MPSCASLHLRTEDLEAVRYELERILTPDFAAYTVRSKGWVSVYAEELETHELDDLERLAMPLSRLGKVIAFVGDDDLRIWRFPEGDCERVVWDEFEAYAETFSIAPEFITHFDAIEEQSALPEGFVKLERDAEKPGLKEFFGRSQDE